MVGAGPNGLAAAIRLAQERLSVLVLEAHHGIGGGTRSAALTLPGFTHDVSSAVHPLAIGSPFFSTLPLGQHGLEWIHPEFALAHPLEGGSAAVLKSSVEATAEGFGADAANYRRLMAPLVRHWKALALEVLQPLLHWPRHPVVLGRFGLRGLRAAAGLVESWFGDQSLQALFAGLAAHSFLRLDQPGSAAFGLLLGAAGHAVGWPFPRGGSQKIAEALAAHLRGLGGEIKTEFAVQSLDQLPRARAVLLDVTPRQLTQIAGKRLPASYRKRLQRFRYGPGVFKIDYALGAPIPWRGEACRRAGTVHVCGTMEEVAASEAGVAQGMLPQRPFVLLAQPSVFDSTRAPAGKHTAWAYCHVPNGSTFDMTDRVERQVERFAPGFRDCVLARHTSNCVDLEKNNPNLVGGDINGGSASLAQLLARPILSPVPYRTPVRGLYLCSASTPPGGGVHGMCGFHAAEAALRDCFR